MLRTLAVLTVAIATPSLVVAQASDDALERARAVDACAGRPVLSAEVIEGGRLNVTCGREGAAANGGGAGLGAGGGGALLGALLLLGLAAGAGGGGSADGT